MGGRESSLSTLEARNEHIDIARANVLPVEFVSGPLDVVLRAQENKASACLPPESLLEVDVFLLNLDISEELDHLGLGDVTRHAAELDALRQVVLVQNPLEIHTDAAKLVIHE